MEVEAHCPPKLFKSLQAQLEDFRQHVTPFVEIRNRRVGHIDFGTALDPKNYPLMGISRPHVDEALKLVSTLMNDISLYFEDTTNEFARAVMHGTGEHLVFYLDAALKHFDEEEQRVRARFKNG